MPAASKAPLHYAGLRAAVSQGREMRWTQARAPSSSDTSAKLEPAILAAGTVPPALGGWQTPGAGLLPVLAGSARPRQASAGSWRLRATGSDLQGLSLQPTLPHLAQERKRGPISAQACPLHPSRHVSLPRSTEMHQPEGWTCHLRPRFCNT